MTELAVYYARCNRHINRLMLDTLRAHLEDPYGLPIEGYFFHTLGQILEHGAVSDRIWLEAFAALDPCGLSLADEFGPAPGYGDRVYSSFDEYTDVRGRLDDFFCRYTERLEAPFFSKIVSRRTRDGQLMERPAWKSLVHLFNHQTHHRGQVSAILDARNIENNYSNMIFLDY